jgi:uncharacterized surface protein with fasciclin (FAS1) repeats
VCIAHERTKRCQYHRSIVDNRRSCHPQRVWPVHHVATSCTTRKWRHSYTGASLSAEGAEPTTIGGGKLKISLKGGVTVNGANVKKADFPADNGVIHVIDAVLVP